MNVRNGRADWTYVPTGNMVNVARFGWFKDWQSDTVNNALINPDYGTITLSVNGVGIGFADYLPRIEPSENRYEGADNLSWTVGKHSFKFGVDYLNTEDYYNLLFYANGDYSYPNADAFALDFSGNTTGRRDYSSYTQGFGNPIVDTYLPEIDWYAQDQYRATPNLTLYYGVRYEKNFLPQPPSQYVNPAFPQTGRIPQDNLDFAPRVGFAWSLNGGNVVRSGYGIYYGRYLGAMLNTLFTANNLYQQTLTFNLSAPSFTTAGPIFPNLLPNPAGTAGSATIEFAAPNFRTPYTQQGDFAIEQQINSNTSLTVSYMWDRGAEFFSVRDLNLPDVPPTNVTYSILNSAGGTVGTFTAPIYLASERLNRNFLHIYEIDNGGNSYYNGLSVQVQHHYAARLSGRAGLYVVSRHR